MVEPTPVVAGPQTNTRGRWMALIAALLGWMFDGFEIGMFPLVGKPALMELLDGQPASVVDQWFGVIVAVFLIGAASGGVFFGWLGDKIGRVRAMALSIFTYAIFTGLCGFAAEAWQIAALRFIASLGMGGEWSLGVALVNEIWPQRSRAFLAGLIGAAANVGILLGPLLSLWLITQPDAIREGLLSLGLSEGAAEPLVRNQAWRLMMIAGALPALLIFFIRMFVPESARWEEEHQTGSTKQWAPRDLFGAVFGTGAALFIVYIWSPLCPYPAVRAIGTPLGLIGALVGFIYPVLMYLRRAIENNRVTAGERRTIVFRLLFGAAISSVALLGTWGSLQWAPSWSIGLAAKTGAVHAKEYTQISLAIGAIIGTILAALTADWLGRRLTYAMLCVGSTLSLLAMYQWNDQVNSQFYACVFVAGAITAAFYGWFPLYLPELFPTAIRATSQGFAYNFGRAIAAIGTLQTAQFMAIFDGSLPRAGSVMSAIYLAGVLIIWLGPETKGKPLPE